MKKARLQGAVSLFGSPMKNKKIFMEAIEAACRDQQKVIEKARRLREEAAAAQHAAGKDSHRG